MNKHLKQEYCRHCSTSWAIPKAMSESNWSELVKLRKNVLAMDAIKYLRGFDDIDEICRKSIAAHLVIFEYKCHNCNERLLGAGSTECANCNALNYNY